MNLPANPLHRLLANSDLPSRIHNPQLNAPCAVTAGKVYMYYPHAWWIQQVNGSILADDKGVCGTPICSKLQQNKQPTPCCLSTSHQATL